MKFSEFAYLSLDGCKVARLDFNQQVAAEDIDNEPIKGYLKLVIRLGIPLLQSSVKGFLVQRADLSWRPA